MSQKNAYDTGNFDSDFTRLPPQFTPVSSQALNVINQNEFRGFSFVNDKFAANSSPPQEVSIGEQKKTSSCNSLPTAKTTDLWMCLWRHKIVEASGWTNVGRRPENWLSFRFCTVQYQQQDKNSNTLRCLIVFYII